MKLLNFKQKKDYIFYLTFEDGITQQVNLSQLLKSKVTLSQLQTAHIDKDWGCLEFNQGMTDIDPKTLYNYSINHSL